MLLSETEAHPTDEGEGPGPQDGRHPAGATGESAQGHPQYLRQSILKWRKYLVSWLWSWVVIPANATKRITEKLLLGNKYFQITF